MKTRTKLLGRITSILISLLFQSSYHWYLWSSPLWSGFPAPPLPLCPHPRINIYPRTVSGYGQAPANMAAVSETRLAAPNMKIPRWSHTTYNRFRISGARASFYVKRMLSPSNNGSSTSSVASS